MKTLDTKTKNKVLAKSAGTARLGNIAKSATPPTSETLEKIRDTRRRRYELLSSIRSCYIAEGKKKGLFLPTEYHRTSLCKHAMTGAEVHLFKKVAEVKKGYFVGLQTCGSVWTCPICANRIQEVRRQEIATAMDYFYKAGKQAVMVTFTFPHTAKDTLKSCLNASQKHCTILNLATLGQSLKISMGSRVLFVPLKLPEVATAGTLTHTNFYLLTSQ